MAKSIRIINAIEEYAANKKKKESKPAFSSVHGFFLVIEYESTWIKRKKEKRKLLKHRHT